MRRRATVAKPRKIRIAKSKGAKLSRPKTIRSRKLKPIRLPKPKPQKERVKLSPPKGATNPQEWLVNFLYEETGKSIDLIVVAFTAKEAVKYAREYLRKTPEGRRVLAHFKMRVFAFKPARYRHVSDLSEVEER